MNLIKNKRIFNFGLISLLALSQPSYATQSNEELAKKLANPVASLISVPFQVNYDENIGLNDKGSRITTNIQPVVPISLNKDWNLISRTILPVVSQKDVIPNSSSEFGIGDTVQSLFFSPVSATDSGWIWGAGPVFLLPTASDKNLGTEKWGAGITGVALKQTGAWSYGALANHIESVAGDRQRSDVSSTFMQPFLAYTTSNAMTISLNTESTYDWESKAWTVPVNFSITQVVKFGEQLVSIGGGLRYWAKTTNTSPEGVGIRLQLTLLFPK